MMCVNTLILTKWFVKIYALEQSFSLYLCFMISCAVDICMTFVMFLYFLYIFVHMHISWLDCILWMNIGTFIYVSFYNFWLNFCYGENKISVLCSFFLFDTSRTLFSTCYFHHFLVLSNNNIHWSSYAWMLNLISVFGFWKNKFI